MLYCGRNKNDNTVVLLSDTSFDIVIIVPVPTFDPVIKHWIGSIHLEIHTKFYFFIRKERAIHDIIFIPHLKRRISWWTHKICAITRWWAQNTHADLIYLLPIVCANDEKSMDNNLVASLLWRIQFLWLCLSLTSDDVHVLKLLAMVHNIVSMLFNGKRIQSNYYYWCVCCAVHIELNCLTQAIKCRWCVFKETSMVNFNTILMVSLWRSHKITFDESQNQNWNQRKRNSKNQLINQSIMANIANSTILFL